MFEQAFKNIDNTLRKEAGCATELDYIGQTSWILFLKYLDDFDIYGIDTFKLCVDKSPKRRHILLTCL